MVALMKHDAAEWALASLLAGYAEVPDAMNVVLRGLAADSRKVAPGDVFFAVGGGERHGLQFAEAAVAQGAVAVVYEPETATDLPRLDVPLLPVEQLPARLGLIADRFYFQPSEHLAVVGVTGTNGKTSVTHYVADALRQLQLRCGVVGTLGCGFVGALRETGFTTPDAVAVQSALKELKSHSASAVAMEVSSHALVQHRVAGVHFDVAVFTNLSRDHLDYHGDMASYAQAKQLLLAMPGLRHAVINADDPAGRDWLRAVPAGVEAKVFTTLENDTGVPTLRASDVCVKPHGISLILHWQQSSSQVQTRLIGRFNVENLLATGATLLALGYPFAETCRALAGVSAVPGRMEQFSSEAGVTAIVDYAHTPDALEKALQATREHCRGSLLCVFGCGGDRDTGKRPLMARVAEQYADKVFVTDDNPRSESASHIVNDILSGFVAPASVRVIHDRRVAIRTALEEAGRSGVVLIAGKGHERYQWIGDTRLPFSDQQVVTEWMGGAA